MNFLKNKDRFWLLEVTGQFTTKLWLRCLSMLSKLVFVICWLDVLVLVLRRGFFVYTLGEYGKTCMSISATIARGVWPANDQLRLLESLVLMEQIKLASLASRCGFRRRLFDAQMALGQTSGFVVLAVVRVLFNKKEGLAGPFSPVLLYSLLRHIVTCFCCRVCFGSCFVSSMFNGVGCYKSENFDDIPVHVGAVLIVSWLELLLIPVRATVGLPSIYVSWFSCTIMPDFEQRLHKKGGLFSYLWSEFGQGCTLAMVLKSKRDHFRSCEDQFPFYFDQLTTLSVRPWRFILNKKVAGISTVFFSMLRLLAKEVLQKKFILTLSALIYSYGFGFTLSLILRQNYKLCSNYCAIMQQLSNLAQANKNITACRIVLLGTVCFEEVGQIAVILRRSLWFSGRVLWTYYRALVLRFSMHSLKMNSSVFWPLSLWEESSVWSRQLIMSRFQLYLGAGFGFQFILLSDSKENSKFSTLLHELGCVVEVFNQKYVFWGIMSHKLLLYCWREFASLRRRRQNKNRHKLVGSLNQKAWTFATVFRLHQFFRDYKRFLVQLEKAVNFNVWVWMQLKYNHLNKAQLRKRCFLLHNVVTPWEVNKSVLAQSMSCNHRLVVACDDAESVWNREWQVGKKEIRSVLKLGDFFHDTVFMGTIRSLRDLRSVCVYNKRFVSVWQLYEK